jgi:hypothetical protein
LVSRQHLASTSFLESLFSSVPLISALAATNDSFSLISTDVYIPGKEVQFTYNHYYYPIDRIHNAKRSYYESRIALNQFESVDLVTLPYIDFVNGGRHVLCADFETLMSDSQSGCSSKNWMSIDMSLEFNASASRVNILESFVSGGDSTIEVL